MAGSDQSPWQIVFPQARFLSSCGTLGASLDLNTPADGLQHLRIDGSPMAGHILGAAPPGDVSSVDIGDAYIRGNDVVVDYRERPSYPFGCQFYWRAATSPVHKNLQTMVTLLASVQTSRLESHPVVDVHSTLVADAVVVKPVRGPASELAGRDVRREFTSPDAIRAVAYRLSESAWSYIEIVESADLHACRISSVDGHRWTTNWILFDGFLEKGVIRRTRAHGLFVRTEDLGRGMESADHFLREMALPLTA